MPLSSAGCGGEVAAEFCVAAIGVERHGSIVRPASGNGTVGLIPTAVLVSCRGEIVVVGAAKHSRPHGAVWGLSGSPSQEDGGL